MLPLFVFAVSAIAQTSAPANWLDPDRAEPPRTYYKTFSSRLTGTDVSYLVYLPPIMRRTPIGGIRSSIGCMH